MTADDQLRQALQAKGLRYVGTRGNMTAPVCIVGEAPGADEDASGVPFCGSSGKELDRMLSEAGFNPTDCWFTNVYKTRPPSNEITRITELGIPNDTYLNAFREEMDATRPRIVIACGATATAVLCPHTVSKRDGTTKITQWRGSVLSSPLVPGAYVVPVYHPAAVLREWSERPVAVLCLGKAREELDWFRQHGSLQPLPQRELITEPSYQMAMEFLDEAINQPQAVSNDIETFRRRYVYTIAIAHNPYRAISFGLWRYPVDQLVQIWRKLDILLRTHSTIGQNYIGFDAHQLFALGFSPNVNLVSDTMVRHHTLWPEFEHKLQFQGFQYTREPYWKDEGKEWHQSEGLQSLMHYNALDAAVTYEIHNAQEGEFNDRPWLRQFYNEVAIKRARAFYRMDDRGFAVDKRKLGVLRDSVLRDIDKNCQEAEALTGKPVASGSCLVPSHKSTCKCNLKAVAAKHAVKQNAVFNLGSPKQIIAELEARHVKIPMKRATKYKASRVSVDEETLRKIVLANDKEKLPLNILNVRELNKMLGTYIDARLHNNTLFTSFAPTATLTFRSGSRGNSFGFGTNLQNTPKHSDLGRKYRECIPARAGKVFVAADQKGAEDWPVSGIIADVSGRRKGLDELLSGINRHRKLASFLFGLPESEIDKAGMQYYLGKRTRHAGNYGMRAPTMANNLLKDGYPIPEKYCAWLLEKFHEAEPDIRGVFHKWVEETLNRTRTLRNPLGFERVFFGLRPFSDNSDVYRQGYAQIPQSTVACNNGMAIVYIDELIQSQQQLRNDFSILLDGHDSITLEVPDCIEDVILAVQMLTKGYKRDIIFPNGLKIEIPIEVEMGYNLGSMTTCQDHLAQDGLIRIFRSLKGTVKAPVNGIGGVLSLSSKQP